MTKATDIDDIIATKDNNLIIDVLWDDPVIVAKIRAKLEKVSAENMKYYHVHFCGESIK